MNTSKRILPLLLLVAMLLTMLPAWAGAEGTTEKLSPEPITYKVMIYEHESQPWVDNPVILDAIFEKTNVRLELNPIPSSDYITKQSMILSTNQMPDIIKVQGAPDVMATYASSGMFLNISDYWDYAPDYKAYYDSNPNFSMYNSDGKTYGFMLTAYETNVIKGPTMVMRYDLLEKNGLEFPATMEDVLTVMKALKEIYPDSQPWSVRGNGGTQRFLRYVAFMLGSGSDMYYEPKEGKWLYGQITDNYKAVLDYLSRAYEMGVLDVDYATMNNQLWQEKMNTGKAFMYVENPVFASSMTTNLRVNDPDALLNIVPMPSNNITNSARAYLYNQPGDNEFILSADIENPEIAVKFMNWCYTAEGILTCNYGIEGVTFEFDENGDPQYLPAFVEQFADKTSTFYAVKSALGSGELGFSPCYIETDAVHSLNYALGLEEDPDLAVYESLLLTDPAYLPGVIEPPFTDEETEEIADILTPVDTYLMGEYDKFIMGQKSLDEWDDVVAKVKEMGIERVVELYNIAYDRALGK